MNRECETCQKEKRWRRTRAQTTKNVRFRPARAIPASRPAPPFAPLVSPPSHHRASRSLNKEESLEGRNSDASQSTGARVTRIVPCWGIPGEGGGKLSFKEKIKGCAHAQPSLKWQGRPQLFVANIQELIFSMDNTKIRAKFSFRRRSTGLWG